MSERVGAGRALWLPFEVRDLDAVLEFYVARLGLERTDGWQRDGERGVVLKAAGEAFLEFVEPATRTDGGTPLAFEVARKSDVDSAFAALAPTDEELLTRPHTYPRGHYGFSLQAPAGTEVMVWSQT